MTMMAEGAVAAGAAAQCNIDEAALYICKYDRECASSFFINGQVEALAPPYPPLPSSFDNYDVREYERNVFYHHHRILVQRSATHEMLTSSSLCNDTNVQSLWLVAMRMSHPCDANEVYELGVGCVCRHGKLCSEEDGTSYYGTPYLFILITIGVVSVLVVTIVSLRTAIITEEAAKLTIREYRLSVQPQ